MLLDIGLPGLDGFEVAARIRAQARFRGLRLIAITGYGQQGDRARTREAGFAGHLVKPVDFTELKRVLGALPLEPLPGHADCPPNPATQSPGH